MMIIQIFCTNYLLFRFSFELNNHKILRSLPYQPEHIPLQLPVQKGFIYPLNKTPHTKKTYSCTQKKNSHLQNNLQLWLFKSFSVLGNLPFYKLPDWLLRWSLKNGGQQPQPIRCGRFWTPRSRSDSPGFSGRGGPFLLRHSTCGIEKGRRMVRKKTLRSRFKLKNLSLHSILHISCTSLGR